MKSIFPIAVLSGIVTAVVTLLAVVMLSGQLGQRQAAERQVALVDLAESIIDLDDPSLHDGLSLLDEQGMLQPRHATEVIAWLNTISPTHDFYALDLRGRIVAPEVDGLELTMIPMKPMRRWLDRRQVGQDVAKVLGPDPRDAAVKTVFSIALVPHRGEPQGYLYVVPDAVSSGSAAASALQGMGSSAPWVLGVVLLGALLCAGFSLVWLNVAFGRPLGALRRTLGERLTMDSWIEDSGDGDPKDPIAALSEDIDRLLLSLEDQDDMLAQQSQEIERLRRVRREVLANFTHDLRTPIATLRGYLETLALGQTLSLRQRQDYLEIALRHSERLSRLVDELLELSRLDRYEVAPRLERFRLGELVQDNIQRFSSRAEQRQIQLEADFDPDLPPVFADVALMERALENLISNALRHSEAGDRVCVRLQCGERRLEVSVIDSGSGIAPEDLPHVFDRFFRKGRRNDRGAGLGLAITHRIAALHGGELTVESQLGVGSCFSFSLEIAPLTIQLSTAEQERFKPTRWPPRFTRPVQKRPTEPTEIVAARGAQRVTGPVN